MAFHTNLRSRWGGGALATRLRRDADGWTLLELVVVMALIIVLASMAVTQHRHAVTRMKEAVLKENLFRMRDVIDQYYADKNKYPTDLEALVSDQYMREVPKDPITGSSGTWQTVPAPADPANPSAEAGIYDVKSGSGDTALDGTQYADW